MGRLSGVNVVYIDGVKCCVTLRASAAVPPPPQLCACGTSGVTGIYLIVPQAYRLYDAT